MAKAKTKKSKVQADLDETKAMLENWVKLDKRDFIHLLHSTITCGTEHKLYLEMQKYLAENETRTTGCQCEACSRIFNKLRA